MSEHRDAYGTWPSPIPAEAVASAGIDFGHVALDGGAVYWREQRPDEGGRSIVVRHDGQSEEVTPPDVDVRTRVHEYGGGDFAVHGGVVFFARDDDQRVYRQPVDGDRDPAPITPAPETEAGLRYADFAVASGGDRDAVALYCVREDHDAVADGDAEEPVTTLVRIGVDGDTPPTDRVETVASGHDFYAAPRLSPDGDRLAWLTWDHPRMPWDGTELHVADCESGALANERVLMGGPEESVFGPAWGPDGRLHAASDRTGWWNLYRREGGAWRPYREEAAEYGAPQWTFDVATCAVLDDGRVAAVVTREGEQSLELLDADGRREPADLPYETFGARGHPQVRSDGTSLYLLAGGPATPTSLVRWTPGGGESEPAVLRRASDVHLDADDAYFSTPEHVTIPTRDGSEAYAYVYPPTNPDVEPPAPGEERPPLVVTVHGGPTSATHPTFDLGIQFFTSRGIAVADVNYRGSTGYGRGFREALYGEWGVVDVADCVDAARHLADEGRVDPGRTAIRGGSAGGFVALSALAFHDEFEAGTSYYGVSDLERLADLTHKFESRYLDRLVGPYPEAADTYRARSPVDHADGIDVPVLLLQGADDRVVPRSQAEAMVDALEARGVPHHLEVFEGERHGFRRAASRERAHELELAFYGAAFGFDPDDDLPALSLAPGGD